METPPFRAVTGKYCLCLCAFSSPEQYYDDAATRRADTVLASDCCARFGRALTRSGSPHLCDSMVAGLAARRDNVLASICENHPFRYPPVKPQPHVLSFFTAYCHRLLCVDSPKLTVHISQPTQSCTTITANISNK